MKKCESLKVKVKNSNEYLSADVFNLSLSRCYLKKIGDVVKAVLARLP